MKKYLIILLIFFWSMIFPNLSFNQFTTDIVNENISYSNFFYKESRKEILKNAELKFFLF